MAKLRIGKNIADMIRIVPQEDQIILPRFRQFLTDHRDAPFNDEITKWVADQLSTVPRNRTRSFAGSASGSCLRAQILQYIGAPRPPDDVDDQLQQIFNDGKWRHLRLQAQLLQAGIIPMGAMELPLPWPAMRAMGTADGNGVVPDDHPNKSWRGKTYGLEIKGSNSWVAQIMKDPDKYLPQVHRYFLVGGFDLFVILVENKNTQELREWVIEPDPAWMNFEIEELNQLNEFVDHESLPPRLPACELMKGDVWRKCPFGGLKTRPCATLGVGKVNVPRKLGRWESDPITSGDSRSVKVSKM